MLLFCETCTPPDFRLLLRCWQWRDGGAESGRQRGGGEVEGPTKSQRRGASRERHRIHNSHSSWAAAGHHAGRDKPLVLITHFFALSTLSYSNTLWSQDWDTCVLCLQKAEKDPEEIRREMELQLEAWTKLAPGTQEEVSPSSGPNDSSSRARQEIWQWIYKQVYINTQCNLPLNLLNQDVCKQL